MTKRHRHGIMHTHPQQDLTSSSHKVVFDVAYFWVQNWGAGVPCRCGIGLDVFLGHIGCLEGDVVRVHKHIVEGLVPAGTRCAQMSTRAAQSIPRARDMVLSYTSIQYHSVSWVCQGLTPSIRVHALAASHFPPSRLRRSSAIGRRE